MPASHAPVDVLGFLDRCRSVQLDTVQLLQWDGLHPDAQLALKELRQCLLKTRQALLGRNREASEGGTPGNNL